MKKNCTCGCDCVATDIIVVNQIKKDMPKENTLIALADLFKIIQVPTRLQILWALDQSEMCVGDIANVIDMSKSSISHQLAVLKKGGLVARRKVGKLVYYSLDDNHIKTLFEVGLEHVEHKGVE